MSFIGDLSKGFIRSAVNQVGRDGGKVISNQVYGNAHSTPINSVSPNGYVTETTGLTEEKEYIFVKFFWAILLSLIPIFGGLFVIARGILNFTKKYKPMYKLESQRRYKSDKRFKGGAKFIGMMDVKIPVKAEIDEPQKRRNTIKGIVYCIIGITSIAIYTIKLRH